MCGVIKLETIIEAIQIYVGVLRFPSNTKRKVEKVKNNTESANLFFLPEEIAKLQKRKILIEVDLRYAVGYGFKTAC